MAPKKKGAEPDRTMLESPESGSITKPSHRTVPSPSDEPLDSINKENRDTWEKVAKNIAPLLGNSGIVSDALHDLHQAIDSYGMAHAVEAKGKAHELVGTLESRLLQAAARNSARQSRISKDKPKKRNRRICDVVIEAMRLTRRDDKSLSDFLEAAAAGSIAGISITKTGANAGGKYLVSCDEFGDKEEKAAKSTMEGWWTKAV